MASFDSLYNEIEFKVKAAIIEIEQYRSEKERLIRENEQLKEQIKILEEHLTDSKENYNLLAITQTILKKTDKQETKKKINDLVREIDHCMAILKKQ